MNDNSIIISNLYKEYSLNNSSRIQPLKNFSLTIRKGETVGIIGKNGSGKSTLLKIISGLTKPNSGTISLAGNVSSVLDIGSNFAPDLSGLENTEMLLRINGVSVKKNAALIKEIHEFSGIGDFFYQPVKTYSNGMFLRLAFSVIFNIPADILVLDEVLAVGDEEFRMKSFELIKQLKTQKKTIVLVSHNRQEILELCTRCLWLQDGNIKMDGDTISVVSAYFEAQKDIFESEQERKGALKTKYENENGTINVQWKGDDAPGQQNIFLRQIKITGTGDGPISMEDPLYINLLIEKKNPSQGINLCIIFYNHFEQAVFYIGPLHSSEKTEELQSMVNNPGIYRLNCCIPPNLLNEGDYYISFQYAGSPVQGLKQSNELFRLEKAFKIKVNRPSNRIVYSVKELDVSILPFLRWQINKLNENNEHSSVHQSIQ